MSKIAVLDDYQHVAAELADWQSLNSEVEFFARSIPRQQLAATLAEFDTVVLMRERTAFPREVLEQMPNLRLLITTGARNPSVDSDYLRERGDVTMCGTGATNRGARGPIEVTWALILALVKRVGQEDRAIREGIWQSGIPASLSGATLGLLGLGRLGGLMVAPARAFEMQVIAWSENLTTERTDELGVELVSREELFARSDVLSIQVVLSERTRGLISANELALMKPTAFLVNTARGGIVDNRALIQALRAGTIAGAGLDVYEHEPIPGDDELLKLPNTVLLPHLGYVSREHLTDMYRGVVAGIAAYRAGEPINVIVQGPASGPA